MINIKTYLPKDKIFMTALAIAFAWHIFWFCAVQVVVVPEDKGSMKFSNLLFLGPILSAVSIDAKVVPENRSELETKYLSLEKKDIMIEDPIYTYSPDKDYFTSTSIDISDIIKESVHGIKAEPEIQFE